MSEGFVKNDENNQFEFVSFDDSHKEEVQINNINGQDFNLNSESECKSETHKIYRFCYICFHTFRTVRSYHKHTCKNIKLHKKNPYECKNCNGIFIMFKDLVKHINYFHKCKKCDFFAINESKFSHHMLTHRKENKDIKINNESYKCKICHERFRTSKILEEHKSIHAKFKLFCCNVCSKKFRLKNTFYRHIKKMHCSDKNLLCAECGELFTDTFSFKYHIKNHLKKRYQCNVCPYSSIRFNSLKLHIENCHGGKKFICDTCNKKFIRNSALKKHFNRFHNPEYVAPVPMLRNFQCSECGLLFCRQKHVFRHLQTFHSIK